MIISLIGFMAVGKTTMGKELAAKLGTPFIDLDAYIEEKEGKRISEIFEQHGESHFRSLEEQYLQDILEEHISVHPDTLGNMKVCTLVLSLGGGIVTNQVCSDLIDDLTYCIYIKSDIETIFSRVENNSDSRPMLKGGESLRETIEKLYKEREPLYEKIADKTI